MRCGRRAEPVADKDVRFLYEVLNDPGRQSALRCEFLRCEVDALLSGVCRLARGGGRFLRSVGGLSRFTEDENSGDEVEECEDRGESCGVLVDPVEDVVHRAVSFVVHFGYIVACPISIGF